MSLDETEIFLLENIEKYKALINCEAEITEKISLKSKTIANKVIDDLVSENEWVAAEVDTEKGWFALVPQVWEPTSDDYPFCLYISNYGLWGGVPNPG